MAYDNALDDLYQELSVPGIPPAFPAEPQGFLPVGLALAFTDEEHLRPTGPNTADRSLFDRDESVLQLFVLHALSVTRAADHARAHRDFFDHHSCDPPLSGQESEAGLAQSPVPEIGDSTNLHDEKESTSDEEEESAFDDEEGAAATATTTTTTTFSPSHSIPPALPPVPPPSPRTLALIEKADTVHGLGPARRSGALLARTSIFALRPVTESRSRTLARKKAEVAAAAATAATAAGAFTEQPAVDCEDDDDDDDDDGGGEGGKGKTKTKAKAKGKSRAVKRKGGGRIGKVLGSVKRRKSKCGGWS